MVLRALAIALVTVLMVASGSVGAEIRPGGATGGIKADLVVVEKTQRQVYLMRRGAVIGVFPIALGRNPVGPKVFQGDGRTPEGIYTITARNAASRFYRSLRISYPDPGNRAVAAGYGIPPGGDIMIHGQPNDYRTPTGGDWTEGCIAVSNRHMDQIWSMVDVGTPIEIRP